MLFNSLRKLNLAVAIGAIGAAVAIAGGAAPARAASLILDTFNDGNFFLSDPTLSGIGPTEAVEGAEILGGERDVNVERTAGTFGFAFADNSGGQLNFSLGSGVEGNLSLIYDGQDNDPSAIDFNGLNRLDATGGGTLDRISLDATFSDPGVGAGLSTIAVTLYADGGLTSTTASGTFLDGPGRFELLFDRDFSLDTSSFDYTGVGAIAIEIVGDEAADLSLDQVAFTAIPEGEATIGTLLAVGLFGAFKLRQRAGNQAKAKL